jgi:hypothetical protein
MDKRFSKTIDPPERIPKKVLFDISNVACKLLPFSHLSLSTTGKTHLQAHPTKR